jgi:hypothetical protein
MYPINHSSYLQPSRVLDAQLAVRTGLKVVHWHWPYRWDPEVPNIDDDPAVDPRTVEEWGPVYVPVFGHKPGTWPPERVELVSGYFAWFSDGRPVPYYSTQDNDAFSLLLTISEQRNLQFHVERTRIEGGVTIWVGFDGYPPVYADNFALAACRAAALIFGISASYTGVYHGR